MVRKSTVRWEAAIGDIWREALGVDLAPERDVNFFDAGATSLSLLRIKALLKTRYATDIDGVELFTYTTIKDLAEHLAAKNLLG